MAVYRKFYSFSEYLSEIFTSGETFYVNLTNSAPLQTYNNISEITLIDYTYFNNPTITFTATLTGGTYEIYPTTDPIEITATGGSLGPFRYIVINAAGGELCSYYDYGASITLTDAQTLSMNYSGNPLFTVS